MKVHENIQDGYKRLNINKDLFDEKGIEIVFSDTLLETTSSKRRRQYTDRIINKIEKIYKNIDVYKFSILIVDASPSSILTFLQTYNLNEEQHRKTLNSLNSIERYQLVWLKKAYLETKFSECVWIFSLQGDFLIPWT